MSLLRRYYKTLPILLAIAAAFFLIFRKGDAIKIADVLFALLGIIVLAICDMRMRLVRYLKTYSAHLKSAAFLIIFILIGQGVGFFIFGISPNIKVLLNYGKIFFDYGIFFFLAFLIFDQPKILTYISISILVAPVVILPAYTSPVSPIGFSMISGGRVSGFFQSPILFGLWLAVVFLAGLGLFLEAKKYWLKGVILLWLCVIANLFLWSGSRAAWLALSCGLFVWGFLYLLFAGKGVKKFGIMAAGTFAIFTVGYATLHYVPVASTRQWVGERAMILMYQPFERQSRTSLWQSSLALIRENLLGFGLLNSTGLEQHYAVSIDGRLVDTTSPANTFLEIMLYGGAGALAMFLIFIFRLGSHAKILPQLVSELGALEIAWIMATPVVLVDALFTDGFFLRPVWFVLGVTLGVVTRLEKRQRVVAPTQAPPLL